MIHFGLLLFPHITQLDLTGPAEVWSRCPDSQVHLIWKDRNPVDTSSGFKIFPTTTFADCPDLDVLCVPGGPGQTLLMEDPDTLEFIRRQANLAKFVTSVCTGSLLLGAAGLLQGYQATCHWMSLDQLSLFGAIPSSQRVVKDRNRISGGGVTAGIDFGLSVAAELFGEAVARRIQLTIEYAPQPPFDSGTPEQAGPELVAELLERGRASQAARLQVSQRAAAQLRVLP